MCIYKFLARLVEWRQKRDDCEENDDKKAGKRRAQCDTGRIHLESAELGEKGGLSSILERKLACSASKMDEEATGRRIATTAAPVQAMEASNASIACNSRNKL